MSRFHQWPWTTTMREDPSTVIFLVLVFCFILFLSMWFPFQSICRNYVARSTFLNRLFYPPEWHKDQWWSLSSWIDSACSEFLFGHLKTLDRKVSLLRLVDMYSCFCGNHLTTWKKLISWLFFNNKSFQFSSNLYHVSYPRYIKWKLDI